MKSALGHEMQFSFDPTARDDEIAQYVRHWYELHRESWWDRHRPSADRKGVHADEFMLGFVNEVRRVEAAAAALNIKKGEP